SEEQAEKTQAVTILNKLSLIKFCIKVLFFYNFIYIYSNYNILIFINI
ncbi:hypothetical protein cco93_08942, partial [Campylobacter coli H8]